MIKKFLVTVLVTIVLLGATSAVICIKVLDTSATTVYANSASSAAENEEASQDEKDDRPDDADDRPDAEKTTTIPYSEASGSAWLKAYPSLDLNAFLNPFDPTTIAPHTPTATDIALFKQWIQSGGNPRNQVMKEVTNIVGETIANEMWDYLFANYWQPLMNKSNVASVVTSTSSLKNVGAMQQGQFAGYFGQFFASSMTESAGNNPNEQATGQASNAGGYQYQSIVSLINDGYIVSSDGKTYRLHNAKDGSVAYEIPVSEFTSNEPKAFTMLIDKTGSTYWQTGIDDAKKLETKFNVATSNSLIAVTMLPDPTNSTLANYPYLDTTASWKITFPNKKPTWWSSTLETAVTSAFNQWKSEAYSFDLTGFLNYFNTLPAEAQTPSEEDIELLKQWAIYKNDPSNEDSKFADDSGTWAGESIWNNAAQYLNDKFGEVYGQCPGPTVVKGITALGITLDKSTEDKVGSSVGEKEFLGIWFTNTEKWQATQNSTYPYLSIASLWKKGFIPSFDGTTWRLSSGHDGTIVYSITMDELLNDANNTLTYILIGTGVGIVIIGGVIGFIIVRKRKRAKQ
jgi:hypothetical protein